MTQSVRRLAAVLVALAAAVSGCTDSAKPQPLPSTSAAPSVSPSASTSPTAPVLPEEARGTSAASAKAFARFYIDTVNFAARTGITADLATLGTPRCVSCSAIRKNINRIYNAGGTIRSSGWQLTTVAPVPKQPKRRPILDLGVLQPPEVVKQTNKGPTKRYKGGRQPMTMHLRWTLVGWSVERLDLVS
ncbi:DUF6318 family protein [Nocardioides panacis]|uniref:DUF6318 family protein n=1 Tax=Nocardioides panacis TaxID=2849501 RepID=UPI00345E254A